MAVPKYSLNKGAGIPAFFRELFQTSGFPENQQNHEDMWKVYRQRLNSYAEESLYRNHKAGPMSPQIALTLLNNSEAYMYEVIPNTVFTLLSQELYTKVSNGAVCKNFLGSVIPYYDDEQYVRSDKNKQLFKHLEKWLSKSESGASRITVRRTWLYLFIDGTNISDIDLNNAHEASLCINDRAEPLARFIISRLRTPQYSYLCRQFPLLHSSIDDLENECNKVQWQGIPGTKQRMDSQDILKIKKVTNYLWLTFFLTELIGGLRFEDDQPFLNTPESKDYQNALRTYYGTTHQQLSGLLPTSNQLLEKFYIPPVFAEVETADNWQFDGSDEKDRSFFSLQPSGLPLKSIVIGKAGYGKTTFLKALTMSFLQNAPAEWIPAPGGQQPVYFPIFIEGGDIENLNNVWDWIEKATKRRLMDNPRGSLLTEQIKHALSDDIQKNSSILLIIDGLNEIQHPVKYKDDNDKDMGHVYQNFFDVLSAFLSQYPSVGCVISTLRTALDALPQPPEGYKRIFLQYLSKKKIGEHCTKFGEYLSRAGINFNSANTAKRIKETPSLRRILHRPLYLYYFFACVGLDQTMHTPKSPYILISRLTTKAIWTLDKHRKGVLTDSEIVEYDLMYDEDDINVMLSYLALRLIGRRDVHVSKDELTDILNNGKELLGNYLTETAKNQPIKNFIFSILEKLWIVKRDVGSDGKPNRFSFSSRPLLWYYVAYGMAQGIASSTSICANAHEFIEKHLEKWSENEPHEDEWDTVISWIAIASGRAAEEIIELLSNQTMDSSVKNRKKRILCTCALVNILSQRPFLSPPMRVQAYDAAFKYYLYKGQLSSLHHLTNSSMRVEFVEHVYHEFITHYSEQFPPFLWVLGYLDWLNLRVTRNLFRDERKSILKWISLPQSKMSKPDIAQVIINDIMNRCKMGERTSEELIRDVLVLATFVWECFFDREDNVEEPRVTAMDWIKDCSICLLSLLAYTDSCIATISCYALAHLVNEGKIDSTEVMTHISEIILVDYTARKEALSNATEAEKTKHTTQPLCGALRLITMLPIDNRFAAVKLDDEAQMMYREEWLRCLEDVEYRYPYLLYKICYLIEGVWDETEMRDNYNTLRSAKANGRMSLLAYDHESIYALSLE